MSRLAATFYWFGWHLPRLWIKYYLIPAGRRLGFRLRRQADREAIATSERARRLVAEYRCHRLAVADGYLDAEALTRVGAILERSGCQDAVHNRKAGMDRERIGPREFFHLAQERLPTGAVDELFREVLPGELLPTLELAHGRSLRLYSVTYHETDPDDPTIRIGASRYNAHPFHHDGNPKFAKLLIYLSDVDESSGPFEIFLNSRPGLLEELLRLGYQDKHFRDRPNSLGAWARRHLPAWLRRSTQYWDVDAETLQRRFSGCLRRVVGRRGTLAFFDGMNIHNGSRDQERPRQVLHFIFV